MNYATSQDAHTFHAALKQCCLFKPDYNCSLTDSSTQTQMTTNCKRSPNFIASEKELFPAIFQQFK